MGKARRQELAQDDAQRAELSQQCTDPQFNQSNTALCADVAAANAIAGTPTLDAAAAGDAAPMDLNSSLNLAATEVGAVLDLGEALMNSSAPQVAKAASGVVSAAQKILAVSGPAALALGLGTSANAVRLAKPSRDNPTAYVTALHNFYRDVGLVAVSVAFPPLGLALGTLNALLVAGEPDWFANLIANPNGELATRITDTFTRLNGGLPDPRPCGTNAAGEQAPEKESHIGSTKMASNEANAYSTGERSKNGYTGVDATVGCFLPNGNFLQRWDVQRRQSGDVEGEFGPYPQTRTCGTDATGRQLPETTAWNGANSATRYMESKAYNRGERTVDGYSRNDETYGCFAPDGYLSREEVDSRQTHGMGFFDMFRGPPAMPAQ